MINDHFAITLKINKANNNGDVNMAKDFLIDLGYYVNFITCK